MSMLLVVCDACLGERRILTNRGNAPHDTDGGECPHCHGLGELLIRAEPAELHDIERVMRESTGAQHNTGLTDAQWHALPMQLRRRWWDETGMGRDAPSAELMTAIRLAVHR